MRNDNSLKSKTNLVEGDEQIITAVVSQVNMVTNVKEWIVDSGATRHICENEKSFSTYTPVEDGKEVVYLGDSKTAKVLGGKTMALNEVLHVPNIRVNLISMALLGKFGIKVSFESDKIVMTKNNIFVGKGYCNQGLYVLNISEIINENASLLFSCLILLIYGMLD